MKYIVLFINICIAIVTLGCYVSPYMAPSTHYIFPVLSVLTPYLLIANFLFLIYWILFPNRFVLLPLVTLLLGFGTMKRHFNYFSSKAIDQEVSSAFTISSININSGQYLRKDSQTLDQEKYQSLLDWTKLQANTDIICAQEKRYFGQVMLDSMLLDDYTRHGNIEISTGIYTRHPIVDSGFIDVGGRPSIVAWADIKLPFGKIIRVYSLHCSSNMISRKSQELIEESNLRRDNLFDEVKGLFANYAYYSKQRNSQLDRLEVHMDKSPYPVVVAGDFNDVPQSYLHHRMAKKYIDVFNEKGRGVGATYRTLPGLRIDYIYTDESITPTFFAVDDVDISDHYPIRAQLVLE